MNKFDWVSSDNYQMSVAEGWVSQVPFPGGGCFPEKISNVSGVFPSVEGWGGGTLPCDLSHDACDVTYLVCANISTNFCACIFSDDEKRYGG